MFNIDSVLIKLADVTNKFLICIDMQGNYCYTNKAYNNRFGFQPTAKIGMNSLTDVHVDDHPLVIATVGKCCAQVNTAFVVVLRKPLTTGGCAHTQWDFIAIADRQDQREYIVCLGMEVTSFVEDEAAHTTRLEQIAYHQSHMVRRPLANILGLAHLLSETNIASEDEQKELLHHLHTEALELDDIVKTIVSKAQNR